MRLSRSYLLLPVVEGYEVGTPAPREPRTRRTIKQVSSQSVDPTKHYIAVKLSPKSRARLIKHVSPEHSNVNAEHVTLSSHPDEAEIERYRKHSGKQVTFHATHHAHDPKAKVQAVRVRGLDHLSDKEHKHVTISTGGSVSAAKSNDLLSRTQGDRLPNWIPLTGTIEVAERLGRG